MSTARQLSTDKVWCRDPSPTRLGGRVPSARFASSFLALRTAHPSGRVMGGKCLDLGLASSEGKVSASYVGDPGSVPVSGRSPGEGNSSPLQYSCLENPGDRGACQATVHGAAES